MSVLRRIWSYIRPTANSLFKMCDMPTSSTPTTGRYQDVLVVVAGCTGTGKSDLGVEMALRFEGEIINADSMQIYKGLDIVTNKVTPEETKGVKHHMMSFLEPTDEYNVHKFRDACLKAIRDIWARGKLPILCGGTAYYIESVLYADNLVEINLLFIPADLRQENKSKTVEELYQILVDADPVAAAQVHPNNRARVQRAIEINKFGGHKRPEQRTLRFNKTALFVLDADVEVLDERLNKRVDKMHSRGLMIELTDFYRKYKDLLPSHGIRQCIGIKEFVPLLELPPPEYQGKRGISVNEKCTYQLKVATRRYARRQRNWFRMRFLLRHKQREVPNTLVLDTSRDFFERVVPFALSQLETFLDTDAFDQYAAEESDLVFKPEGNPIEDPDYQKNANRVEYCDVCKIYIHGANCIQTHEPGRRHQYNLRRQAQQLSSSPDSASDELEVGADMSKIPCKSSFAGPVGVPAKKLKSSTNEVLTHNSKALNEAGNTTEKTEE